MPNFNLPILVVDDAKFSGIMVSRALTNAGYRDVRVVNNAPGALQTLEERSVSVLIADWLMPEMDGLELTDRVRQLDEQQNHYTYIILLTARESVAALVEAFDRGVDDFIYKSDMNKQLLPRVFAADRLADRQNTLLANNTLLIEMNQELREANIIDPETGLCNRRYAMERLSRSLREAESRGGASAYVLIGIRNWQALKKQYSKSTLKAVATGLSRRLSTLIRPMDAVCRVGENQFAIVAHFPNSEPCTTSAFRRILDGINHKAFKTAAGFVSVESAMTLCKADVEHGTPTPEEMERAAIAGLMEAYETRRFTEVSPHLAAPTP
ncbi:MAG: response regulator [Marinobacter sp.]|nr:response regulator [Marinobacter sp.]